MPLTTVARLAVCCGLLGSAAPAARIAAQATAQSGVPVLRPGAPGQPAAEVSATAPAPLPHSAADVAFMQGMIGHHQQAVEMVALIADRSTWDDLRTLGRRIAVSQADEIRMMQRWLEARGAEVPSAHAMHMHGATLMPGMLTPDEMARLAAARGREFDRLWLEGMIKHHGGALTMVKDLFAQPGAAQQGEIFAFASDVEADQAMEIDRMRRMLASIR
ncbi:MAG: DUF305 domain-containing protein [Vicinamibacterales bacterium]